MENVPVSTNVPYHSNDRKKLSGTIRARLTGQAASCRCGIVAGSNQNVGQPARRVQMIESYKTTVSYVSEVSATEK